MAALGGALVAVLAARNNGASGREDQEMIALAAGAIPLAIATGGVGARVLATERGLEWLLLSAAASVRMRAFVATGVTMIWGAFAGALHGVATAIAVASGAARIVRIVALSASLGASLAAVAAHLARRAERPTGVDGTVVVAGMAAASVATTAITAWLGAPAIAPIAAAGVALAASTAVLLARRERLTEHAIRVAWEDA
jgi:hypothetical protein